MYQPSVAEVSAVLKLDGSKRYEYFIKKVADWGEAWGLYQDGWLMMGDASGAVLFPLWPAKHFAEACRADSALGEARAIDIDDLLDDLLPRLQQRGGGVAVFPTPLGSGVTPGLDRFRKDLEEERGAYE